MKLQINGDTLKITSQECDIQKDIYGEDCDTQGKKCYKIVSNPDKLNNEYYYLITDEDNIEHAESIMGDFIQTEEDGKANEKRTEDENNNIHPKKRQRASGASNTEINRLNY